MPLGSRFLSYLSLVVLLSGCVGNDLLVKRQSEAESKIEFLIQSSKKMEQRSNEFENLLLSQDDKFLSLNKEIKLLKEENSELKTSRDELKLRLAHLLQQSQTPKVEIVNEPSPVNTAKESGPPVEYVKSFGLYSSNNFVAAIQAFEAFIKNNPQSEFAANALYWIGECHYTLSDLPKAKEAFEKIETAYPKSNKAPDALLKLGYTLSAMKDSAKATAIFEKIITMYPSSPLAVKARERLNAR